jgi:hypothetical protein
MVFWPWVVEPSLAWAVPGGRLRPPGTVRSPPYGGPDQDECLLPPESHRLLPEAQAPERTASEKHGSMDPLWLLRRFFRPHPRGFHQGREALSQYIVRPPLSLQKLLVDEGRDAVVYVLPTAITSAPTQRSFRPPRSLPRSSSTCPTHVTDSFAATACTPLVLGAYGLAHLTSCPLLPRVGDATTLLSLPSVSVRPMSVKAAAP